MPDNGNELCTGIDGPILFNIKLSFDDLARPDLFLNGNIAFGGDFLPAGKIVLDYLLIVLCRCGRKLCPFATKKSFISCVVTTSCTALFSLLMIASGVPAGARIPHHKPNS